MRDVHVHFRDPGVPEAETRATGAAAAAAGGFAHVVTMPNTTPAGDSPAWVREQIEDFETTNNNLRVERSLMSSATRIDRIATQNYGMVPAASFDVIVIDNGEEAEAEAEVESEAEVAPEAEAPAEDAIGDEAVEDAESTPVVDAGLLAAGL